MAHIEVRFDASDLAAADQLSDALGEMWELDVLAVAIVETSPHHWQVTAFVSNDVPFDAIGSALDGLAQRHGQVPAFEIENAEETDWVREGLKTLRPVHAGRFLVHGGHDRRLVRPGQIAIEIDAGQAFGTGHHGTTAGCLTALSDIMRRNIRPRNCLDVGCGSGVLAIAAAKSFKIPVVATDIDPLAVSIARDNTRINESGPFVRFGTGSGIAVYPVREFAPYDLVFANILARPLITLAPDMAQVTAPGGLIILSGLLIHQRPLVQAAYENAGFDINRATRLDGWSTLLMRRRSLRAL